MSDTLSRGLDAVTAPDATEVERARRRLETEFGPGLTTERIRRCFDEAVERFANTSGHGLGLDLVERSARRHLEVLAAGLRRGGI